MIFSVFQNIRDFGYSWSKKSWFKPRFPLVEELIANFSLFLDVFEFFFSFWMIFSVKKKGF